MTSQDRAKQLLLDWALCSKARPKHNAVNIQIEKDTCGRWAVHLIHNMNWGSELELTEACNQFESRLKPLKEKLVIEVLKNGSV